MKEFLVITTGGTFNKQYNPVQGSLVVSPHHRAVDRILSHFHNIHYTVREIIGKDSLDFSRKDREYLAQTIQNASQDFIIVVHGTDTMEISARYVQNRVSQKTVFFTGSMVPYSIDQTETTANLAMCIGYILHCMTTSSPDKGVFIGMHGAIEFPGDLQKNREKGEFVRVSEI